jgi:phytoene dehydrogenase-like protein
VRYDVVVIGSGLAGLTAALHLARGGHRVCVIERRPVAGGLCGHWTCDGHVFVRACNEFAHGLVRELADLGVKVDFEPTRSTLFLGGEVLQLPPDLPTVLRLGRRLPAVVQLAWSALRRPPQASPPASLAGLLGTHPAGEELADLVGFVAQLAAVPLEHLRLEDLREVATAGYGMHLQSKPVGGPQAIIDAMVARLGQLGGALLLGTDCLAVGPGPGHRQIHTTAGTLLARQVVSSVPRWDLYPSSSRPGLRLGHILLAVQPGFRFPGDVHTVYHVPRGVRGWMGELDAGRWPSDSGFSVLRNLLPEQPDHRTLHGYFIMPRGHDDLDPVDTRRLTGQILDRASAMLPGLRRALLYQRLLSPAGFRAVHGLESAPVALWPPPGFRRPDGHDPVTDIHHVGNSVRPTGDAVAAVFTGARAARRVAAALAQSSPVSSSSAT